MKRLSLSTIVATFCLFAILSTAYAQQWINQINVNNLDDKAFGIVTDRGGNIYITGYATRPGTGEDMILLKFNSAGALQWTRYYDGPEHSSDRAFGIVVDNSDNVIITGYSTGVGSLADFTTIKFNSAGAQLWVQRYNAPGNGDDRAFGIVVDRVGNIYVTGYITQANADIYTIKYNPNGVYIWGAVIFGSGNSDDKAFGIVVDSLGNNIYLCGYTNNDTTGYDFTVARYDSSGSRLWLNDNDGGSNSDDKAFGIVVDADHNIYSTGYSTGASSDMDLLTRKYSNSGTILWNTVYNDTLINRRDRAFGIVVDQIGNSYVTGFTTVDTSGTTDYLTMKLNTSGEIIWKSHYNGTGNFNDTAYAICLPKHAEGVYVTGGCSSDTITGKMDVVTLKYSLDNGQLVDSSRFNGADNKNDIGYSIVADTSGNVFVGGHTETIVNKYDILLMKYLGGILISVNQISTEVPRDFKLYQNYPNPFNPSTKIKFDIKKSSMVKLVIYDILGRVVAAPVNEVLKVGTYEVEMAMPDLSSGIYFYELSTESYRSTMKMILIK
ncbi:MAG: SBBP repeat-containing protein [Ignavibacteria bacterium]